MQACHNFFNSSNAILEAVPEVRIFHFQDGGDVTNPAGLSPCILPRKCKSGPMPPSGPNIREFKQIATADSTTAAAIEKVWGEYVSFSKAK